MSYAKQLRRGLFALPLLALGVMAAHTPPPRVGAVVDEVVSAGLACSNANREAGPLGLARMPGDLGLLTRRLHCAS